MALLNHEETIAFLTQKEIRDAFWMRPQKRCVANAKFKCDSCWTETEITDPRFATEVMKKNTKSPKCPICGETMRCISYDVETRDYLYV